MASSSPHTGCTRKLLVHVSPRLPAGCPGCKEDAKERVGGGGAGKVTCSPRAEAAAAAAGAQQQWRRRQQQQQEQQHRASARLQQLVWLVPQDLPVLAGPRLPLVPIHDEVMGAVVVLGHEGPLPKWGGWVGWGGLGVGFHSGVHLCAECVCEVSLLEAGRATGQGVAAVLWRTPSGCDGPGGTGMRAATAGQGHEQPAAAPPAALFHTPPSASAPCSLLCNLQNPPTFMPVENPAPPRPRNPLALTSCTWEMKGT